MELFRDHTDLVIINWLIFGYRHCPYYGRYQDEHYRLENDKWERGLYVYICPFILVYKIEGFLEKSLTTLSDDIQ